MKIRPNSKIAFSRVLMPSGECLRQMIVEFDAHCRPVSLFPLEGELPFTEWHDMTFVYENADS